MTTILQRVPQLIAAAALPRLIRHFTSEQSNVLAGLMVPQSMYETSVNGVPYQSAIFTQNNNIAGYKAYDGSIYQVGVGLAAPASEGDSYGAYASVEDCAREIADWIGRRAADFEAVASVDDYAAAMSKNGYFTQSAADYAAGMIFFYSPAN